MIIYSRFNSHRKKEFQLVTTIRKKNDFLFSTKIAQNKRAVVFLNSLRGKYKYLIDNDFSIEPVKPIIKTDQKLQFKYQSGKTLDYLLFQAFQERDKNKFINLVVEYAKLIRKNKISKKILSQEFQKIFGYASDDTFECIETGCIDLNFDNIIFDKNNEYNLIDYEWTFEFPVPYKYIIFRALINFYSFHYCHSLNAFISLGKLYSLVGISDNEKKLFIKLEYNFQSYVNENINALVGKFEKFQENHLELEKDRDEVVFLNIVQQKDQELNNLNQAIQQKDQEINNLNQAIQQKDQELNNLNRSIQRKEQQINSLNQTIQQKIQQKDQEINNLNQTIQQKDQELYDIRTSLRWKIPNYLYKQYKKKN